MDLPTYGIWIAQTESEADAAALAGIPPNLVVYTTLVTTGTDALAIAAKFWPGKSIVREVAELKYRAVHT
jgi:hypothetical protein